jgi:hypothetical protein
MFKSKIWSPNRQLTSDAFNQMASNDIAINEYGNISHGYGLQVITYDEEISIDIDDTTGQEILSSFDIYVSEKNEVWMFGGILPNIITDPGETDVYTAQLWVEVDNSLLNAITPTISDLTIAYTISGNFAYKFATAGRRRVDFVIATNDAVNSVTIRASQRNNAQIFCMSLGVVR